jgi:tRNA 2-thiocytidine biosynthesis protein TtcA
VPQRSKHYYEKRLRNKVGEAIHDFRMIEHGDRVMVAVSGGKDSLVMIKILTALKKAAPVEYELIPVHVATGYELDFPHIADWIRDSFGLEVLVHDAQISEILNLISDPEKSPCALCSRLRRGKLYALAEEMGVSSIALGHHMDDIIETFMLRCFYTGQIGAMAPSRYSNDNKNRIIRPLAYCTTELVNDYFRHLDIKPVTIKCPIRKDSKRELIRDYLKRLETDIPRVKYSLFASLSNIDMKSLCLKVDGHADPH